MERKRGITVFVCAQMWELTRRKLLSSGSILGQECSGLFLFHILRQRSWPFFWDTESDYGTTLLVLGKQVH